MAASPYLANALIAHLFRTASFSKPAHLYVGLFTTAPTGGSPAGVEVSFTLTGYARVQLDSLDANWTLGADGTVSNAAKVQFANPSGNWGTVVAFGVWDAATGGNLLVAGALANARAVYAGDAGPFFDIGTLIASVS